MPILDIQRRVHEIGRIRLGEQTTNRPRALPTFRFTSVRRELIDQVAATFGGTVTKWGEQWECVTETNTLDVLVPPEDVSFSQWWESWTGGGCVRRCDGVHEVIHDTPCVCTDEGVRVCEATTRLSLIVPAFREFGVWRVETHSWYAAGELRSAVELALGLAHQHGGALAPATLRIEARAVKRPGAPVKRFTVPVLDVAMAPVLGDRRAVDSPENATQGVTMGPASLDIAGLPAPTPRLARGEPSPPPMAGLVGDDDATPPTLPTPSPHVAAGHYIEDATATLEAEGITYQVVDTVPPPTPNDDDARLKRGMFAQLRDVVPDNINADTLRYALAVLETGKVRDVAVSSWNELTHDELVRVSQRLVDIKRGALHVAPMQDRTGVVFTTNTGRTARVFTNDEGTWSWIIGESNEGTESGT